MSSPKPEPDARLVAAVSRAAPPLPCRAQRGRGQKRARSPALCSSIVTAKSGSAFENQRYRASGLNLAVAAVILWNTVYPSRAVAELRANGETIPDDLLAHIAPLGWEHIAFNGDYIWPAEPLKDGFRSLQDTRSSFLEAA
jgi:Tn3 transposase DDE domain